MRLLFALVSLTGLGCGLAAAEEVPLPRPRPPVWTEPRSFAEAAGPNFDAAEVSTEPTDCDRRLQGMAAIAPIPRLIGPGACGGRDMVELDAVLMPDKSRIDIKPAPVLRCEMAESFAAWVRDETAPRVARLGSALRSIENYDSYECRGRNRVSGAKLSEHAKGNAVDVRAVHLADGRRIEFTDMTVDKSLREDLRDSACHRFTTVLGPGADAYHESHIHLDIDERRQGYRICQWDVREPPPPPAAVASIQFRPENVPLPIPRPANAGAAVKHPRKL
jgi:hypothetical protein